MQHHYYPCKGIFLLLLALAITTATKGQKRPHLEVSSTISAVTNEEITTVKIANVTEVLTRDMNTHALKSRNITYNFNQEGIGQKKVDIFYNCEREPTYLRAVTSNELGVPINAIEQVEILKSPGLQAGYAWNNFGGIVNAQLYNSGSKKYEETATSETYTPRFQPPQFTGSCPVLTTGIYGQKIEAAFSKNTFSEQEADHTFGNGMRSVVLEPLEGAPFDEIRAETVEVKDENGVVRERVYTEYYARGYLWQEIWRYNCNGELVYYESAYADEWEEEDLEFTQIHFRNGKPVDGYRYYWDEDEEGPYKYREFYNPQTEQFEWKPLISLTARKELFDVARFYRTECTGFPKNVIVAGPSLVREDSYDKFNLFGGYVDYTRFFTEKIGVTGHVGFNFGTEFNTKYTKLNFLAGVTVVPFNRAGLTDQFTFSAHVLGGLLNLSQKYSNGGSKYSDSYFNVLAGVAGDYNFNSDVGVRAGIDYNPVFVKDNTAGNMVYSLGVRYNF